MAQCSSNMSAPAECPPPLFLRKKVRRHSVYVPCVCRAEHWVILPNQVQFLFNKMQIHEIKHISHRTFYMWPSKETNLLGCKCLSRKVLHSADGQQKPRVLSAASSSWYQHHHSLGQKSSSGINSSELQTCVVGQN